MTNSNSHHSRKSKVIFIHPPVLKLSLVEKVSTSQCPTCKEGASFKISFKNLANLVNFLWYLKYNIISSIAVFTNPSNKWCIRVSINWSNVNTVDHIGGTLFGKLPCGHHLSLVGLMKIFQSNQSYLSFPSSSNKLLFPFF